MPYGVDSYPLGGVAPPAPKHEDGGRVGNVATAAEKAEANPPDRGRGANTPPPPVDFSREPITHPQKPPVDYGLDVDARLKELEAQAALLNGQIAQIRSIQAQQLAPARPEKEEPVNDSLPEGYKEQLDGRTVREHPPVVGEGGEQWEGRQAVFPDRARAPEVEAGPRPDNGEDFRPDGAGSPGGGIPAGPDDGGSDQAHRAGKAPKPAVEEAAGPAGT